MIKNCEHDVQCILETWTWSWLIISIASIWLINYPSSKHAQGSPQDFFKEHNFTSQVPHTCANQR